MVATKAVTSFFVDQGRSPGMVEDHGPLVVPLGGYLW